MTGFVGGKNGSGVYQRIISMIPPHDVYIEPFVGTGAVLRKKRPAKRSIALDLSPGAIDRLGDVRSTPPGTIDSHGGTVPGMHCRSSLDRWGGGSSLLATLELIVGDGVEYLRRMAFPPSTSVFVYADPPYVKSSRADPGRDYYEHEWTDEDHRTFLAVADRLNCCVMISGYESELYRGVLQRPKWRSCRFQAQTRRRTVTEWLWMNYQRPQRLHDYRYIGSDFTDRWRIKKRQRSWIRMLRKMPSLERRAMLAAMIDAYGNEVLSYLGGDVAGNIDTAVDWFRGNSRTPKAENISVDRG